MKIDTDEAGSAVEKLGKHALAATEIVQTMQSTATGFGLPDATTGQSFGNHLNNLVTRMAKLLETCSDNAAAADGDEVVAAQLKQLNGVLGWDPPIPYSDADISVAFDELVPDLIAGNYYQNDSASDLLWGDDGEPSADDFNQGSIGDCWLLAVIGSMAEVNPDRIKQLITDHGDGTYTVHLASGDVEVNESALPNSNNGNAKWVKIVEYAYAQHDGSYSDIVGGEGTEAMEVVFGLDSDTYDPDDTFWFGKRDPNEAFDSMEKTLNEGRPVTVEVHNEKYGFGAHELMVTGIVTIDGVRYAKVRNPWGHWGEKDHIADKWKELGAIDDPDGDRGTLLVPADAAGEIFSDASEGR